MNSAVLMLAMQQSPISSEETALKWAVAALNAMGYQTPKVAPSVRSGYADQREPAYILKGEGFTMTLKKSGVLSNFQRTIPTLAQIPHKRKLLTPGEAKEYLTKVSHLLSTHTDAIPESVGWKPGNTRAFNDASEIFICPIWTGPNRKKYSLGMMTADPVTGAVTSYFPGHSLDYPEMIVPLQAMTKKK